MLHAIHTILNTQGSTFILVALHDPEGFALNPSWSPAKELTRDFQGRNEIAVSLVHYLL